MRGLDTNVLVRYLTQDDPVQLRQANAVISADTATFDRALRGSRLFRVL
jgi:predicted nucleic-acid-binding protein